MKKLLQAPLLLALMLLSSAVMASGLSNSSTQKLMDLSGLSEQLADTDQSVLAGIQQAMQQGAPISQEQFGKIEKVVKDAFKSSKITATVSSKIKSSISSAEAKELLAWFRSDLGRKITREEINASNDDAFEEMIAQAEKLMADKKRVEIAQQIDSLVNATDMALEIQKYSATAVYASISKAMKPNEPVNYAPIEAKLDENMPQMRQQMHQLVILSLVYNYRNIDVADMEKYVAFLGKSTSKKFNTVTTDGMNAAMKSGIDEMAASLATILTAGK